MTSENQVMTGTSIRAQNLWYLECWGLKRIDSWGASYVVCMLALFPHHALSAQTGFLMAAITANYWLGYLLNDYFDAPYDRLDDYKAHRNIFVQSETAREQIWYVVAFVLALSALPFLSFGWRGVLVLLIGLPMMWAYSAPPFRFKSKPGWDLIIHALFVETWPYLICMWLIHAQWTQLDTILISVCVLTSLNSQLNQQVRDFAVDARTDTNFTTRVGLTKTILILKISTVSVVMVGLFAVLSGRVPWLFIPLGLAGIPISVHQLSHTLNNSGRIFPRRLVYIIMPLLLIYTGILIALEWTL